MATLNTFTTTIDNSSSYIDITKVYNIANNIIDLLNQNKVTSNEFEKIISVLFYQKNSAHLIFSKTNEKYNSIQTIPDKLSFSIDNDSSNEISFNDKHMQYSVSNI